MKLVLVIVLCLCCYCQIIACQSVQSRYRIDKISTRVFGDGSKNGALYIPRSSAISNSGEIYISEQSGIRKVDVNGTYSSLTKKSYSFFPITSGSIASQSIFYNPGRMMFSPYDGLLYIVDNVDNRLVQFSNNGRLNVVLGKIFSLNSNCMDGNSALNCYITRLTDFKIDARNGDVYFIDGYYSFAVRKLSKANNTVSSVFSVSEGDYVVTSLSLTSNALYMTRYDTIYRYNLTGGNITKFAQHSTSVNDIEFCENGDYYYSSYNSVYLVKLGESPQLVYSGTSIVDIGSINCTDIYITDNGKSSVFKLDNTGQVSIIAGNGNAGVIMDNVPSIDGGVISPRSLLLDDNGDLLIGDYGASRIRKVSSKSGLISTIAGNGNATFNGIGFDANSSNISPSYLQLSRNTRELHFVDQNNIIRKINKQTGTIDLVAGLLPGYNGEGVEAKFAYLSDPTAVIPLNNGEIIISENNRIRKILVNGLITTIAGGNQAKNITDGPALETRISPALTLVDEETHDIYFLDYITGNIRKYENATKSIVTIIYGNDNYLFARTSSNEIIFVKSNRVFKYDMTSNFTTLIAGNGNYLISPDNNNATGNSLTYIRSISVSKIGNIYIVENYNIRMISPLNNSITTIAGRSLCTISPDGSIAKGSTVCPSFVYYHDATNELYFVDYGQLIRKIGTDGKLYTIVGVPYTYGTPYLVANNPKVISAQSFSINSNGDIYFAENARKRVSVFKRNESIIETIVNGEGDGGRMDQASFGFISKIAFSKTDDLYVASTNIRKLSAEGQVSTEVISSYEFIYGSMVVSDIDNSIFVTTSNSQIYKINSTSVNILAGKSFGSYSPDGTLATGAYISLYLQNTALTQLPNGEIYFQDSLRLRRIGSDGKLWTVAGTGQYSYMDQNVYSDGLTTGLDYMQDLIFDSKSGKFYFIGGAYSILQVFSMTPYCASGYVFEDAYKTKCMPICFGINGNESNVCSGNGNCAFPNTCQCKDLYVGANCSQTFCDTPSGKSNSLACPSETSSTSVNTTISSSVQTVSNFQTLNDKTVSFSNVESVKIDLPSSFSDYLSKQVTEPIQLVSVLSKQDSKPIIEVNSQDNSTLTSTVLTSVITLLFLKTSDGGKIKIQNLTNPISFSFTNITSANINSSSTLVCSYFDEDSNSWKFDGLETQITSFSRQDSSTTFSATCKAFHLTSFVILDKNLKKTLTSKNDQTITLDLTDTNLIVAVVVSTVGGLCVLGVVVALVAIVCIVLTKRRKNKKNLA